MTREEFIKVANAALEEQCRRLLGEELGHEALEALIRCLDDPDRGIQVNTARVLYEIGTPRALEALTRGELREYSSKHREETPDCIPMVRFVTIQEDSSLATEVEKLHVAGCCYCLWRLILACQSREIVNDRLVAKPKARRRAKPKASPRRSRALSITTFLITRLADIVDPHERATWLCNFFDRFNARIYAIKGVQSSQRWEGCNYVSASKDVRKQPGVDQLPWPVDEPFHICFARPNPGLIVQGDQVPALTIMLGRSADTVFVQIDNRPRVYPLTYPEMINLVIDWVVAPQINQIVGVENEPLRQAALTEVINVYSRPGWIASNVVDHGAFQHEGTVWTYSVLPGALEPALGGFLGFFEEKHLFISEDVPSEFREWQLRHELIEMLIFRRKQDRCIQALLQELKMIPADMLSRYTDYRRQFFRRLVDYYTARPKARLDAGFLKRITASRDYLDGL